MIETIPVYMSMRIREGRCSSIGTDKVFMFKYVYARLKWYTGKADSQVVDNPNQGGYHDVWRRGVCVKVCICMCIYVCVYLKHQIDISQALLLRLLLILLFLYKVKAYFA